jgi:hypothetical protein
MIHGTKPLAPAEISARITALRSQMFDLVGEVQRAGFAGNPTDLSIAVSEMQSAANRLGTVEAVLHTVQKAA